VKAQAVYGQNDCCPIREQRVVVAQPGAAVQREFVYVPAQQVVLPRASVDGIQGGVHQVAEVERPPALQHRLPVGEAHAPVGGPVGLAGVGITVKQRARHPLAREIHRSDRRVIEAVVLTEQRRRNHGPGALHADLTASADVEQVGRTVQVDTGGLQVGQFGIVPVRAVQLRQVGDEVGDLRPAEAGRRRQERRAVARDDVLDHHVERQDRSSTQPQYPRGASTAVLSRSPR
jgi:hypothetical protein